ncbi:MAG: hypothetical protein INR65_01530 [Gluconacetobacter diazotrophicus]|nr:hypothetical protein [Gluconacetobacter diazotrophicus]
MPFFVVSMSHPVGRAWHDHLPAHLAYLQGLVSDGRLRASGRLKNRPFRSGLLVFKAADEEEVRRLVEADPFAVADLIHDLSINEWEPFLGVWAAEVDTPLPAPLAAAPS